ncbi:hypothetical protein [Nocardia xishanensis]|uniref:hypothetical protein n=1 Tax=Nocardia xishanensis TaxID=238964 RepID=UPI00343CFC46
MADIYGLPDTTGRKEGDTWTTTLPDGRTVVNTIPQGNGNQTVDQVITNPDGSKTNSRVAGNGLGGWQRWNDDSTGTSSYAGKDTQDSDVYGQHFNPGESTSGRPSHEFGMSSDYKTTATASYDQQGNRVGTDVGHANTNGLYDNVHVDNYGNKTFSATTRDGNGGLVSTFTGQVDSDGYGWKILGDKRWDVSPDSQGKPVLTRTETTDKGVHLYRIDESGKTTHEFRGNKPGQWYRDTIGTDAEGKTTITRLDVHLGVTVYDTEGNILEGGPKVAPGTIDTLGIADKVIDTVFFWNPIAKGGNKAGVHALVGLGAMAGLWDDVSVPLNLPTQEQAFDGLVDTGKNLAKEYLYLGGTFKDTNGNPIYSPDGKLDQQHATLNFYNDLSKAVIGTDWSQFPDKPLETLGTAGFGIATFFIPGPKGLTGLANGERLAAGLGEAGARAAIPDQPWPSLPERIGGATDEGGVAAGGGTRSPGAVDRAMAAAREAMEALRRPWESPKEAWEGTGFGPGTPRRNQPMDSEGARSRGSSRPGPSERGSGPSVTPHEDPENFWDLVQPTGKGTYTWKKSGWYNDEWHKGGTFAELPKQDLHYNAKVVDKSPGQAELPETDPFVIARKNADDDFQSYQKAMENAIKEAELGTDVASITGGNRDAVFDQLRKDNRSKREQIKELEDSIQGYFDREKALIDASEDLGEAGAIAEAASDVAMDWELISKERGQGVLDLIFVSRRTGEILVVDAKGGGRPSLGKGAWIESDEFPGMQVRGREGTTPYLIDRLRKQPGLRDKLRQLDQENGWNLEQILDKDPDLSNVEYRAIQTDPTGKIYNWQFREYLGPQHPEYVAPPGFTPRPVESAPDLSTAPISGLNQSIIEGLGAATNGVAALLVGIPPLIGLGLQYQPQPTDQSLRINISAQGSSWLNMRRDELLRAYADLAHI